MTTVGTTHQEMSKVTSPAGRITIATTTQTMMAINNVPHPIPIAAFRSMTFLLSGLYRTIGGCD